MRVTMSQAWGDEDEDSRRRAVPHGAANPSEVRDALTRLIDVLLAKPHGALLIEKHGGDLTVQEITGTRIHSR